MNDNRKGVWKNEKCSNVDCFCIIAEKFYKGIVLPTTLYKAETWNIWGSRVGNGMEMRV